MHCDIHVLSSIDLCLYLAMCQRKGKANSWDVLRWWKIAPSHAGGDGQQTVRSNSAMWPITLWSSGTLLCSSMPNEKWKLPPTTLPSWRDSDAKLHHALLEPAKVYKANRQCDEISSLPAPLKDVGVRKHTKRVQRNSETKSRRNLQNLIVRKRNFEENGALHEVPEFFEQVIVY